MARLEGTSGCCSLNPACDGTAQVCGEVWVWVFKLCDAKTPVRRDQPRCSNGAGNPLTQAAPGSTAEAEKRQARELPGWVSAPLRHKQRPPLPFTLLWERLQLSPKHREEV